MNHTIGVRSITASLDFNPDGLGADSSSLAHLIDAVVQEQGTSNDTEVRGYHDINAKPTQPGDAKVAGTVTIDVDPLDLSVNAGLPLLLQFDFVMTSSLQATADIGTAPADNDPNKPSPGTPDLILRQDLLHVNVCSGDPCDGGATTSTPPSQLSATLNLDLFNADLFSIAAFWDPYIFGLAYVAPYVPINPDFRSCNSGGTDPGYTNGGSLDDVVWPFDSPGFIPYGSAGLGVEGALEFFGPSVLCAFGGSDSGVPAVVFDATQPGDPIPSPVNPLPASQAGTTTAGAPCPTSSASDPYDTLFLSCELYYHPVPGIEQQGQTTAQASQPSSPPAPSREPDVTVQAGQTLVLCGNHEFNSILVMPGGTIAVAGNDANSPAAGPGDGPGNTTEGLRNCDPSVQGNFGSLNLSAEITCNATAAPSTPGSTTCADADKPTAGETANTDAAAALAAGFAQPGCVIIAGTVGQTDDQPPGPAGGTVQVIGGSVVVTSTGTVYGGRGVNSDDVTDNGAKAGDSGGLTINAVDETGTVEIDGTVSNDASNPTYNGFPGGIDEAQDGAGGGHGGVGGQGQFSADIEPGGTAYGDKTTDRQIDPGAAGAGVMPEAGNGGGTVSISGAQVIVDGRVSANGGNATAYSLGTCDGTDGPPEAGATSGPGGGAGGGILIEAASATGTGTLSAFGGNGADGDWGGGGGGGGGIVKILAPRGNLDSADVHGGDPGQIDGHCPISDYLPDQTGDIATGGAVGPTSGPAGNGAVYDNDPLTGVTLPSNTFYFQGSNVSLPSSAVVRNPEGTTSLPLGSNTLTTTVTNSFLLCGEYQPPAAGEPNTGPDNQSVAPSYGFVTPSGSGDDGFPCGGSALGIQSTTSPNQILYPQLLGTVPFAGDSIDHTFAVDPSQQYECFFGCPSGATNIGGMNGYWGDWTEVKTQTCTSETDSNGNPIVGVGGCADTYSPPPNAPEAIYAVETQDPAVSVTSDPLTNSPNISINVTKLTEPDDTTYSCPAGSGCPFAFPGLASLKCATAPVGQLPDPSQFVDCGPLTTGSRPWTLPDAQGVWLVWVKVTDNAGNSELNNTSVQLETTPPTVSAVANTGPDELNGWSLTPRLDSLVAASAAATSLRYALASSCSAL